MFNQIDSQELIALSKLSKLVASYAPYIFKNNGDGKNFLRCCGLTELILKYENALNPHSYNGVWRNANNHYNPQNAIIDIIFEIESDKKALGIFLKEYFGRISEISENDYSLINNFLESLGYKLLSKQRYDMHLDNKTDYTITALTSGVIAREDDLSYLEQKLKANYPDMVTHYDEAISTFGNSEYQSCISNCRTILEKIFEKNDLNSNDFTKGVIAITNEKHLQGTNQPKYSQKGIFEYWLANKKGFNRARLFITIYSLMSGLGPHREEIPTKEDALLCLRSTEDVLIWYFQSGNV